MRPPSVAKGDISLEMTRKEGSGGGVRGGGGCMLTAELLPNNPPESGEEMEDQFRQSREGDVTTPELVITGGNRGVKFRLRKSKLV